ncbi:formylglycine-generating enzyme family protein (plasmid) [Rhizobium sp. CB3060]|uniref:formylglycine-generating enzyme family protein n=1 Tax=Rhizobium sp. CB3060 TaxID=3138255 RepID=UPI0021A77E1C|nr:formylglycine-generating enzyme family protein [Rhizobium tropici]UWU26188.1 formylglycine-generating enzyme family protein [Rhizobium tropici]
MLALSAVNAQAQEPPDHWNRAGRAPSKLISPLSVAASAQMIAIPGGRYPMGRNDGPASEQPRHTVALNAFQIDRTEVTNAQFAEFLNALNLPIRGSFNIGGIALANGNAATIRLLRTAARGASPYPIIELEDNDARIILVDGRFKAASGYADHAVTETTWAGARAYCVWRGADLPTEAQWEAAARGMDDRTYPWGNARPDAKRVSASGRRGQTDPVGRQTSGASPFGVLDMAGSLAEWTKSLKKPYPYRAEDGREKVDAAGERTTRGGDYAYDDKASNFRVSFRDSWSTAPYNGHGHIGFRCAS